MKEIWKDIKDYEGLYQVSNLGRIKRIGKYKNQFTSWESNKILTNNIGTDGYYHIMLSKDNKKRMYLVHRIVAKTFIGEQDNKQVNHIDGNKLNNNINNLEYCSARDNLIHALNLGLKKRKIPLEKYEYIYNENKKGKSYKKLAKEFNVGKTKIYDIIQIEKEKKNENMAVR